MIEAILPQDVPHVWLDAEPWLRPPCDAAGERTTHDVLIALLTGNAQLWRVHAEAWCVTEILNYPRKRVANVTLVGGNNAQNWCRELADTCMQWAKRYQADEIRIVGRRGWLRWFPQAKETTVLTLCLSDRSPLLPSAQD